MYGGEEGKPKFLLQIAPNLHSESAWASPPRAGRAAPGAAVSAPEPFLS